MDITEWMAEDEKNTLCLIEDWLTTGEQEMKDQKQAKKMKTWNVTLRLSSGDVTATVEAPSNMDAKCEMSKQYYGHVFTGQFSRMVAKEVK